MLAPTPASLRRLVLLAGSALPLLLGGCGGGGGGTTPPVVTCDGTTTAVTVAAGTSYTLLRAADWSGACALQVTATSLAAGERLGLLLVNAGGPDNATPSVEVLGTSAFAADPGPPLASLAAAPLTAAELASLAADDAARAAFAAGEALVVQRRREGSAALAADGGLARRLVTAPGAQAALTCPAAPVVGSARSFCVDKLLSSGVRAPEARAATLKHASANALFYVTNDVAALVDAQLAIRPGLWTDFEDYYEGTNLGGNNPGLAKGIRPALHASFGVETDVDGNCRVIFLFTNLAKYAPANSTSFVAGFFDSNDLRAQDASCTGTGSNHADMLYLMDPASYVSKGRSLAQVLDQELPGTMAHELQHNVIYATRCSGGFTAACDAIDNSAGDLWLNEGLSQVAMDVAGFGLNGPIERNVVGQYLNCKSTFDCYQAVSLTTWPSTGGDPVGHYGGSHAFLRWHLDQAAAGRYVASATSAVLTKALVGSTLGAKAAFAAATGLSFEEGYARYATAALLSGEDALFTGYAFKPSAAYGFAASVPWSPLHTAVGKVAYTPLPQVGGGAFVSSLRNDGWGAYVTGPGTGVDASLVLRSSATVKPTVAVVRLKGTLIRP